MRGQLLPALALAVAFAAKDGTCIVYANDNTR